jgi:aminoglycoside/choline kinase family phosphotransferase
LLGAQRNTKIIGIFTRLWKRDGKERYLSFLPRMWGLLERDLAHPGLAPVKHWFDTHIPADVRNAMPADLNIDG